jgi:hypothetical protein
MTTRSPLSNTARKTFWSVVAGAAPQVQIIVTAAAHAVHAREFRSIHFEFMQ